MSVDQNMQRFLIASRSLFNQFFFQIEPFGDPNRAWDMNELFQPVERALFEALVAKPLDVGAEPYGELQTRLAVLPSGDFELPIMLNRDRSSGYWDHPIDRSSPIVQLRFISYFDWSNIGRRDNRYARVRVIDWPGNPELVGKDGLVETCNVRYEIVGLP
jgi:hypothetical protein